MSYVSIFTNAIVVALMAMYIYENERRMGEMSGKLNRTGVTVHGETVDKFVELLSNSCGCKQNKELVNDIEDLYEEIGPCKVKRPSDCMDLDKSTCKSGIYKIYPEKTSGFNVFCEMGEHGGGWTKSLKDMGYVYVFLFTNAIVVALMAMYVYENERRIGEILAKLDQTGNTPKDKTTTGEGVDLPHIADKNAQKVVELLSNRHDRCDSKQDKEGKNYNEDLEEQKGQCQVKRPSDCNDLDKSTCKSGIYKIYPEKTSGFNVFCEMEKHGGGWTVFQRRMNGKINFYRDWESYKAGFGHMKEEYWLGNENLHQLTSQGKYMLRIDMSDFENNQRHAIYSKFFVGSETSGYELDVTGYSGDAGDSMKGHQNGSKFSTIDKDNDRSKDNCAVAFKGGWWYGGCHESNLNGRYLKGSHATYADGVNWLHWKGHQYSLKTTTMMIRI